MTEAEQRIKDLKEISIVIDTWDDLFLDFDPRPFSERALSEDFILELKKRYRETPKGQFTVTIYIPPSFNNDSQEKIITQRLKKHFKLRFLQVQKELNKIRIKGIISVIFGIVSLGFLTFITYFHIFSQLTIELLSIVLMPLGWFGVWEGFSKIVDASPKFVEEEKLSNKLSKAIYNFKYIQEEKKESAGDIAKNNENIKNDQKNI